MAKQTFSVGQVLTAAQLTDLQQTAMLGGAASAKTASYTLVAADAGTAISMTSTSATTITVNTGLFAAGDTVQITNLGSGVTTITAGTATVNTSASLALAQYESGTLDFTSTSAAIFIKGAGAAAAGGANYTLLNSGSTSLSGSNTKTISGISGINQLMIIVRSASTGTDNSAMYIRLNADSTSNYRNISSFIELTGTYDTNYWNISSGSDTTLIYLGQMDNSASSAMYGQIKIDGCNSSGVKPYQFNGGGNIQSITTGSGPVWYWGGGAYLGTSTISSVSLVSGDNFDAGDIYVYGA